MGLYKGLILLKVSTKLDAGQKFLKSVHVVYVWPIGYSHRIHSQKSNKRILNDVSFKKHDFVQNILREKFEEMRTTFIISRNSRSIHLFYSGSIT